MVTDEWEVWVQINRVTEWRDGAVFRTEFVGHGWVPMHQHGDGGDLLYVTPDVTRNPRRKQ